jgi:hypothetical protein
MTIESDGEQHLARVREQGLRTAIGATGDIEAAPGAAQRDPAQANAGVASVADDERYDRDSHGAATRGRGSDANQADHERSPLRDQEGI